MTQGAAPGPSALERVTAAAAAARERLEGLDADPERWLEQAVLDVLAAAGAGCTDGSGRAAVDALARAYDTLLGHTPTFDAAGGVVLRRTATARRRAQGAFATPVRLAQAVARRALPAGAARTAGLVLDPACGTGSLLRAALTRLVESGVPPEDAVTRLHGVELDPVAAAICRAALLADLGALGADGAALERAAAGLERRIVVGEALLGPGRVRADPGDAPGDDPGAGAADDAGRATGSLVWHSAFPGRLSAAEAPVDPVTGWSGGFDVVLANPPWERLKVSRRDWAGAPPSGLRGERAALAAALRARGRHPLTGHGELNAYLLFVETCWRLLAARGRACLLVPAGFLTDRSAAPLLRTLVRRGDLDRLHVLAPEIAAFAGVSARVGVAVVELRGGASGAGWGDPPPPARIAIGVTDDHLAGAALPQEWSLDAATLDLVSPNTGSPPPCSGPRDAALVVAAHRRWGVLGPRGGSTTTSTGSSEPLGPWQVRLVTPLHMTRDARWFSSRPGPGLVPLWEAKHAGLLDPYGGAAAVRYWVPGSLVTQRFGSLMDRGWLAGYRNVTTVDSPRTLLPTPVPPVGVANSLPLLGAPRLPLLLACLASLPIDYLARQKHAGANLNFFKLEQVPVPGPEVFDAPAPWDPRTTLEDWVLRRLAVAVRAVDRPDGPAGGLTAFYRELPGPPAEALAGLAVTADERATALAEIDAAVAVLLGWDAQDLQHVLDGFSALRHREARLFAGRFVTAERVLSAYRHITAASSGGHFS